MPYKLHWTVTTTLNCAEDFVLNTTDQIMEIMSGNGMATAAAKTIWEQNTATGISAS